MMRGSGDWRIEASGDWGSGDRRMMTMMIVIFSDLCNLQYFFVNLWRSLAIIGNFCQFSAIFGNLRQSLVIFNDLQ